MDAVWDVVVIGAGAAGLMAGLRAGERGRRTLVLEKNRRPGVKILMSGGARCNITQSTDNRGIVAAFGPQGKFLHGPLAALSVEDTIAFFEGEGVPTKREETGKIFPVSNKASDVLAALLQRLERSGAQLALNQGVTDLTTDGKRFTMVTPGRSVQAGRVILTTGGQSYPGSGATGDGYRFAARLGHTIVTPRPALAPLTVNTSWVASLRGITLPDVAITVWDQTERLAWRRGSLLFAHFGLSGPVALDVSRIVSGHSAPQDLHVTIDLCPELPEQVLDATLQGRALAEGKKQLATLLPTSIPHRLGGILLSLVGFPEDRRAAGLTREERRRLVQQVKSLSIRLNGTLGFQKAEVTAGGIDLGEVDSRTMQSKLVPGLFLAGEVLDLDGPIGGYNFQAAWSTGWLAGSSV